MRLLDVFCKAGGATKGYQDAGFYVVGVDIEPQPNYCGDEFIQADAQTIDSRFVRQFDAAHGGPPCQLFTAYGRRPGVGVGYENLIPCTRLLFEAAGVPWVIENVPGAPLENPVQLCGSSFGLDVRRHRLFETNWPLMVPPCNHGWQTPRFPPASNRTNLRSTVEIGVYRIPLDVQKRAMGVDWNVTLNELSNAIPPAYTEHIGRQLKDYIEGGALADAA